MADLPLYLPLATAADKYQIPLTVLTRLVRDGKLEAIQLPDGEVAVNEHNLRTKEQIIAEQYGSLVGQAITISEAVDKYNVPNQTLRQWVMRGYIKVITPGFRAQLDEADVAYCIGVYRKRKEMGSLSGAPLLDEAGRPYELKRPELAEYRRRKRDGKAT
jgi:predicted site-specific integrase-resolvase